MAHYARQPDYEADQEDIFQTAWSLIGPIPYGMKMQLLRFALFYYTVVGPKALVALVRQAWHNYQQSGRPEKALMDAAKSLGVRPKSSSHLGKLASLDRKRQRRRIEKQRQTTQQKRYRQYQASQARRPRQSYAKRPYWR